MEHIQNIEVASIATTNSNIATAPALDQERPTVAPEATETAEPTLTTVKAALADYNMQQDVLGKFSDIIRRKAEMDAEWEKATKEYEAVNKDGNLKADAEKMKSVQIGLYNDINSLHSSEWITDGELVTFISDTTKQFANNIDELKNVRKTRELKNELTDFQTEHFKQAFLDDLTSTPRSREDICASVALKLVAGDKNKPVLGSSMFPNIDSKKSLYEYLMNNSSFTSVLGNMSRMGLVSKTMVATGDKERKGHMPMYSTLNK